MWSCRYAKAREITSTTLVTKASWIIVQRWYYAGPSLDRARDASLDTKEITAHQLNSKIYTKNSPFLFLLLFFFFLFFLLFLFFRVTNLFRQWQQPKQKGYCIQPLPNQIDNSCFRQPDAQNLQDDCGELRRNFLVRLYTLERAWVKLFRLY